MLQSDDWELREVAAPLAQAVHDLQAQLVQRLDGEGQADAGDGK